MPAFYFVQIIQRFQMDKNKITSLPVVFLLAMLSCFLWGSATPAIKIGYEMFGIASSDTISIILFAGIRFFLAGILVILVQSVMAGTFIRPEKGSFPSIFKLSLAQTMVQYFCFYVGLAHTTGVTGTILSGTSGFFSIILASVLFRYEKLTLPKVIGCLMGLLGVVVMNVSLSGGVSFHFALNGEFLVLLSAMTFLAYSALGTQATLVTMPMGLMLLILYIVLTPDVRLYIGMSAHATLSFLNIAQYISQSGFISGVDNAGWLSFEPKSAFMIIFSIITVGVVFYMLYVMVDVLFNSYVKPIATGIVNELEEQTGEATADKPVEKPKQKNNPKAKKATK